MPLPGLTEIPIARPEDDLRRLLARALTVLRGISQADPEEPLGRVQVGVATRLHNDIRDALEG